MLTTLVEKLAAQVSPYSFCYEIKAMLKIEP